MTETTTADGLGTVFHIPESDLEYGGKAIRNIENLLDDETTESDITVVCNGGGIDHLKKVAPTADGVRELIADGVRVCACRNSMGRGVSESALVEGVEVVPTAMGELTKRQAAGDSYIRP